MSGRRPIPRHNITSDSPERDVYKKGGKLQIRISTNEPRVETNPRQNPRFELKSSNRSSENAIYPTSRRRHNSQRGNEKRYCTSDNRYLDNQQPIREQYKKHDTKHSYRPSTSVRHHLTQNRKRRNIYSGSGVSRSSPQKDLLQQNDRSGSQEAYKSNDYHRRYRPNKPHRQHRSDTQHRKGVSEEQPRQYWKTYKSQEQYHSHKAGIPQHQYRSADHPVYKNGKTSDMSHVHHRSKPEIVKKSRTREEGKNLHHKSHLVISENHNPDKSVGIAERHNKSDKSYHLRRSDNYKNAAIPPNCSSGSKSYSLKKAKTQNGHLDRSASPTQMSTVSGSSSDDDRAIRMKLLKDKYTKRKAPSSRDEVPIVKQDEEEEEEIFDNKKSSSESDSDDVVLCDKYVAEPLPDKLIRTLSSDSNKSSELKKNQAAASHEHGYSKINRAKLKKKQLQRQQAQACSSSSSNTSSSSNSSSTDSSESDSLPNNASLKRSRWNSGSSSENKSAKPSKHASMKSKPIGPPLANKEILELIKPACKESMIRQRNCKYCALNLKTKDDVTRHTLTQRHRIVTGEYFLHNERLISSPYLGDTIRCTVCNTSLEINTSIERHEDSSVHRQQIHRWMARHQPQPPVKYYIDPD